MTAIALKKLRRGKASMTIDMSGRLVANTDVLFARLSKQFKAAKRLHKALNEKPNYRVD